MEGLPYQHTGRDCRLCLSLGGRSRATWQDIRALGSGAPGTGPSPPETTPAEAQSCLERVLASFSVHADAQVLNTVLLVHGLTGPRVSLRPQSAHLQNSSRHAIASTSEDLTRMNVPGPGPCDNGGVKGTCLAGLGLRAQAGTRGRKGSPSGCSSGLALTGHVEQLLRRSSWQRAPSQVPAQQPEAQGPSGAGVVGARPARVLRKGGPGGPLVSCWSLCTAQRHPSWPPRPCARLCSGCHPRAGSGAAWARRMGRAGEREGHAPKDGRVDTSEASGGLCPALAGGCLGQVHHGAQGKSSCFRGGGRGQVCRP